MTEEEVVYRKLTEDDVDSTAEVLASSFADNPAYAWMHPHATTRARDLRAFFVRNLRWHLPLDMTWVASRGPRILGTSTLEPPGGVQRSAREAVAHWLVPTVRDQGLRTFVRLAAADREFRQHYRALTEGAAYYHVHAVAVAPDFQGRGVGSTLRRPGAVPPVLRHADFVVSAELDQQMSERRTKPEPASAEFARRT